MLSTIKTGWDEHLQNMYSNAFQEFHSSALHRAIAEQLERLEQNCTSNFGEEDRRSVIAWVEALIAESDAQSMFMYRRGYKDCIGTLRLLDVI